MRFGRIICMSAIATCLAFSALAQGLPKANKPEDVGFSSERLKRVTDAFQSEVDKGAIPGAVVLIARNGKIAYFEAFGFQNRESKEPMKTDAIFRIASMSKPITSVAVMMLVEEGKIQLLDPVSRYLPEFKGVQVGVEKLNTTTGNSELIGEPPRQEMTIQDLLRHTSGLTYGIFGKSLVKQAYNEANLFDRIWPGVAFSPVTPTLFEPLGIAPTPKVGQGFGLGFVVRTQEGRNPMPGSPGEYFWAGIWGTAFWVDPREKLITVLMMQAAPLQARYYRSLIRNLTSQALID